VISAVTTTTITIMPDWVLIIGLIFILLIILGLIMRNKEKYLIMCISANNSIDSIC
jgi:hypothetical protein